MSADQIQALLSALASTVLPGAFVVLLVFVAFTVPIWVPVVTRRWRRAVVQVRDYRDRLLRARRRSEFDAGVESLAFEYSLSDIEREQLLRYAAVLWRRYELGHSTLRYAQLECHAWVTRNRAHLAGATS